MMQSTGAIPKGSAFSGTASPSAPTTGPSFSAPSPSPSPGGTPSGASALSTGPSTHPTRTRGPSVAPGGGLPVTGGPSVTLSYLGDGEINYFKGLMAVDKICDLVMTLFFKAHFRGGQQSIKDWLAQQNWSDKTKKEKGFHKWFLDVIDKGKDFTTMDATLKYSLLSHCCDFDISPKEWGDENNRNRKEYMLYTIKQKRNEFSHNRKDLIAKLRDPKEFDDLFDELERHSYDALDRLRKYLIAQSQPDADIDQCRWDVKMHLNNLKNQDIVVEVHQIQMKLKDGMKEVEKQLEKQLLYIEPFPYIHEMKPFKLQEIYESLDFYIGESNMISGDTQKVQLLVENLLTTPLISNIITPVICIEGPNGAGKSTLLAHIVFDRFNTPGTITELKKFDLFFHFVCKQKHCRTLQDLIRYSLHGAISNVSDELLLRAVQGLSVLVLADGFDEVSEDGKFLLEHLYHLASSGQFRVILTTRTSALDKAQSLMESLKYLRVTLPTISETKIEVMAKKHYSAFHERIHDTPPEDQVVKDVCIAAKHLAPTPWNVLILTYLACVQPDKVKASVTVPELLHALEELSLKKLRRRLRKHLDDPEIEKEIETFTQALNEAALENLLKRETEIPSEDLDQIVKKCKHPSDMLDTFFTSTWEEKETGDQASHAFPHQSQIEYRAALGVCNRLRRNHMEGAAALDQRSFTTKLCTDAILCHILGLKTCEKRKRNEQIGYLWNFLLSLVGTLQLKELLSLHAEEMAEMVVSSCRSRADEALEAIGQSRNNKTFTEAVASRLGSKWVVSKHFHVLKDLKSLPKELTIKLLSCCSEVPHLKEALSNVWSKKDVTVDLFLYSCLRKRCSQGCCTLPIQELTARGVLCCVRKLGGPWHCDIVLPPSVKDLAFSIHSPKDLVTLQRQVNKLPHLDKLALYVSDMGDKPLETPLKKKVDELVLYDITCANWKWTVNLLASLHDQREYSDVKLDTNDLTTTDYKDLIEEWGKVGVRICKLLVSSTFSWQTWAEKYEEMKLLVSVKLEADFQLQVQPNWRELTNEQSGTTVGQDPSMNQKLQPLTDSAGHFPHMLEGDEVVDLPQELTVPYTVQMKLQATKEDSECSLNYMTPDGHNLFRAGLSFYSDSIDLRSYSLSSEDSGPSVKPCGLKMDHVHLLAIKEQEDHYEVDLDSKSVARCKKFSHSANGKIKIMGEGIEIISINIEDHSGQYCTRIQEVREAVHSLDERNRGLVMQSTGAIPQQSTSAHTSRSSSGLSVTGGSSAGTTTSSTSATGLSSHSILCDGQINYVVALVAVNEICRKVMTVSFKAHFLGGQQPIKDWLAQSYYSGSTLRKRGFSKRDLSVIDAGTDFEDMDVSLKWNLLLHFCNFPRQPYEWKSDPNSEEYMLYSLKDIRNHLAHDTAGLMATLKSYTRFDELLHDLRDLSFRILDKLKEYLIDKGERVDDIDRYKRDVEAYLDAIKAENINVAVDSAQKKLLSDGVTEVENQLKHLLYIKPLPYFLGLESFELQDIYEDLDLYTEKRDEQALQNKRKIALSKENLLTTPLDGSNDLPSVICIEGSKGAGKSTLLAHIVSDRLDTVETITGLKAADLVLHLNCKQMHCKDLLDLYKFFFPETTKYISDGLLQKAVHNLSVLVLVDDFDEVSEDGRILVENLFQEASRTQFRIILTTKTGSLVEAEPLMRNLKCLFVTLPTMSKTKVKAMARKHYGSLCTRMTDPPSEDQVVRDVCTAAEHITPTPQDIFLLTYLACIDTEKDEVVRTLPKLFDIFGNTSMKMLYQRLLRKGLSHFHIKKDIQTFTQGLNASALESFLKRETNIPMDRLNEIAYKCNYPTDMLDTFLPIKREWTVTGNQTLNTFPLQNQLEYHAALGVCDRLRGNHMDGTAATWLSESVPGQHQQEELSPDTVLSHILRLKAFDEKERCELLGHMWNFLMFLVYAMQLHKLLSRHAEEMAVLVVSACRGRPDEALEAIENGKMDKTFTEAITSRLGSKWMVTKHLHVFKALENLPGVVSIKLFVCCNEIPYLVEAISKVRQKKDLTVDLQLYGCMSHPCFQVCCTWPFWTLLARGALCRVRQLQGPWNPNVIFPPRVEHLHLTIDSLKSLEVLQGKLKDLPQLSWLGLHVRTEEGYKSRGPPLNKKVNELMLHHVTNDNWKWTIDLLASLHEQKEYGDIILYAVDLTSADFKHLTAEWAAVGIRIESLRVSLTYHFWQTWEKDYEDLCNLITQKFKAEFSLDVQPNRSELPSEQTETTVGQDPPINQKLQPLTSYAGPFPHMLKQYDVVDLPQELRIPYTVQVELQATRKSSECIMEYKTPNDPSDLLDAEFFFSDDKILLKSYSPEGSWRSTTFNSCGFKVKHVHLLAIKEREDHYEMELDSKSLGRCSKYGHSEKMRLSGKIKMSGKETEVRSCYISKG